jgi:pyruvate kinase
VAFEHLPRAVAAGDAIFLNDGFVQLRVTQVAEPEVRCIVTAGGELSSRKGVNLPGADLGISAFTERDRECLTFALEAGVDLVSQSFVSGTEDLEAVREAGRALGHEPFVIAKIERAIACERREEIVDAADGIMVARGDLGVEIPVEDIALAQKRLIRLAKERGKPVITATQMLESMISFRRPTRAEATDVANAILDGTDAVMLSGESAVGKYPIEAVRMLAAIAASIEPHRQDYAVPGVAREASRPDARNLLAAAVARMLERADVAAILAPTRSGFTARSIVRYRPDRPVIGVSAVRETCRQLALSYGVEPVHVEERPEDWRDFAKAWLERRECPGGLVLVKEGPSPKHPDANHRLELLEV